MEWRTKCRYHGTAKVGSVRIREMMANKNDTLIRHDKWFREMPGLMVLTEEKAVLDRLLKNIRGNDFLQIGGPNDSRLIESARVSRLFFLDEHFQAHHEKSFIQAHSDCLPIQSEAIDIVLLMHQLESNKNSRDVLEEADRVLRPNGRLIIVGFNRWGVKQLFYRDKKSCSVGKIKQILCSLDFEITHHQTICFRPAFKNKSTAQHFLFLEALGQLCLPYAGAVFILCATKNIVGMTPLIAKNYARAIETRFIPTR